MVALPGLGRVGAIERRKRWTGKTLFESESKGRKKGKRIGTRDKTEEQKHRGIYKRKMAVAFGLLVCAEIFRYYLRTWRKVQRLNWFD